MEAVVVQALGGEEFCRRRVAWAAKGAGGAKTRVVKQDDQDVGSPFGGPQRRDRRVLGVGVFRVVGDEACARLIGDGEDCSLNFV